MKLFYGEIENGIITINEDEQQHIVKVLRIKNGDEIFITNGKGSFAKGNLIIEGKKARLDVIELTENTPDFTSKLHIAIAPTKNIDRIEFFVEKAVEMGISEITIFSTDNTERKNVNIEKITKQAIAASKQSLRFHFPIINEFVKFQDFIKTLDSETTFVAYCNENLERIQLNEIPQHKNYTFLIGPEGDFSDKEIKILAEKGIKAVSLGFQRLRTETAGLFVAAWNYNKMI